MGTLGAKGRHVYEVWEVYGDPHGPWVVGGRLYRVWEVVGTLNGRLYGLSDFW